MLRECALTGSSPLARGLPSSAAPAISTERIIPARAGFTRCTNSARRCAYGSSPLARGLPSRQDAVHPRVGIIPARAGFTWPSAESSAPDRDHPRSRGVYAKVNSDNLTAEGSSPLARGLPDDGEVVMRDRRIIPARAGFTCKDEVALRRAEDHPRSRGVYRHGVHSPQPGRGSSPLARGLPRATALTCRPPSDHPRSRGVYRTSSGAKEPRVGSSPLARGLPTGSA